MLKPNALVVFGCAFNPDQDSASLRMLNILRLLCEFSHTVTFVMGKDFMDRRQHAFLETLHIQTFEPSLQAVTDHIRRFGARYELILISGLSGMIDYLDVTLKYAPNAKLIFDTTDLQHVREYRRGKLTGNAGWLQIAMRSKQWMLKAALAAHCTLVVSAPEKAILERECPGANIQVLSNIHECKPRAKDFDERSGILFMGSFPHHPNQDAVEFFLDEVEPLLRGRVGEVDIWLAGREPPEWLAARATKRIHVPGFVADIEPLLQSSRLGIAPLRYGAGVKGKVLESMSYGLPMVGTSIAAEGMPIIDGQEMLVADSAQEFANAIVRLYNDRDTWERLSARGRGMVEEHFSFRAARRNLKAIFSSLGLNHIE